MCIVYNSNVACHCLFLFVLNSCTTWTAAVLLFEITMLPYSVIFSLVKLSN